MAGEMAQNGELVEFKTEVVQHLAVTTPAVRMVVMEVRKIGEELTSAIHQAVALVGMRRTRYTKPGTKNSPPKAQGAHDGLVNDGWRVVAMETIFEPLFCDPQTGILVAPSQAPEGVKWRAATCPWPQHEDDQRLAMQLDTLAGELVRGASVSGQKGNPLRAADRSSVGLPNAPAVLPAGKSSAPTRPTPDGSSTGLRQFSAASIGLNRGLSFNKLKALSSAPQTPPPDGTPDVPDDEMEAVSPLDPPAVPRTKK